MLPPPYVRWLGAAVVLLIAGAIDLAARETEPVPFAATSISAGAPLSGVVEWRDVPRGLIEPAPEVSGFAARDITAGEPITAGAVRGDDGIPPGWWSVPLQLPDAARPGASVRLISVESALDVRGLVASPGSTGTFSVANPGLVAVPPDSAAAVARAAAGGELIVLIES